MATARLTPNLWLIFGFAASAIGLVLISASTLDVSRAAGLHSSVNLTFIPVVAAQPNPENRRVEAVRIADGSDIRHIARTTRGGPAASASGPWVSPLYPQNGVTLWDRVRTSTRLDRRAFLLGTAIQLHAPIAAATPGVWRGEGRHPGGVAQELPISTPAAKTNAPPTITWMDERAKGILK